jgi:hypothetical protein
MHQDLFLRKHNRSPLKRPYSLIISSLLVSLATLSVLRLYNVGAIYSENQYEMYCRVYGLRG